VRKNAVDILGIGAQKSATSWAHHVLNLQPDVWVPQKIAHSGKEVNFWDRHYARGLQWYARIMTPPAESMKSMDVSPSYARIGAGKIEQCRRQSPTARIFYLLRNPIYRDWSSLLMEATMRNKFDFTEASFVDMMVYYDKENVARFTTYANTIKNWRQHFGDQLFVGLYDDVVSDPYSFYESLCGHCGLDPNNVEDWRQKVSKRIFAGPGTALPAQLHEFLLKKYRPMVLELEQMIERDLSGWLTEDPKIK
jgi:Sulfotransferase family